MLGAMRVWVYSPTATVRVALHRHVEHLGFAVDVNPARASVMLIDLSTHGASLPPAPATPSVALLGTTEAHVVAQAHEAGYAFVVLPTEGSEHLRYALANLLAQAGDSEQSVGTVAPPKAPELTAREREVLNLLMLGLTNKKIAKHLGITERTVKFHVAALMRKYKVNKRMALMLKNPIVVTRVTTPNAELRVEDRGGALRSVPRRTD